MKRNSTVIALLLALALVAAGGEPSSSAPGGQAAPKPELVITIGHLFSVGSIAYSRDGKLLASGGQDKTIKLWDVASGRLIRTLVDLNPAYKAPNHDENYQAVLATAFSPDGKTLAAGSWDETIKLWSVPEGKLLGAIEGKSDEIISFAFSPDGKVLASGSDDTTIRFWDVTSCRLLCTLALMYKEDWVVYTPEGYFDATEGGKKYVSWTVGMKNYSFEQFWDEYYRPGLFSQVIRGEKIEGGKH